MPVTRTKRVHRYQKQAAAKRDELQAVKSQRSALQMATLAVIFLTSTAFSLGIPVPMHTSVLSGLAWLDEILAGHPMRCSRALGMSAIQFCLLYGELLSMRAIEDSRYICGQEQLAIMVYWMVHGSSQWELQERFQRSGDTISRYVNRGLIALTDVFYQRYVCLPANKTLETICKNPRYYPFFCYCRGAVDGVHVLAYASADHLACHRDRHGLITQNVLATCDFSLRFLHAMPGYKGTAGDGLLFQVAHENGYTLEVGCFYLADAGFPNCDILMTPYCGVRYHLKEWRTGNQRPRNPQELFNLRHARLRNVIERSFGVIKRCFPILTSQ
ncbi:unnamed protein product [Mycena citricolor]|uniref:DDE Tnp4 domain-containing protein n=1 Tax=Mycena citricolor TaxID=2018698 RepID=A0AAD2HVH7_9AGAR|nr:unnamed protein product [Mycena citricolor]